MSVCISVILLTSCSNLDIEKLNNKANDLMNTGDIDGAISRLESINDLNPGFPQTHYNLGVAYHKKGNYDKSVAELNKAIKLKPDFADAYYTLGVVCEENALNLIDQNKNNKTLDEKTILTVSDNFKEAQKAYIQYINLAKNSSDTQNIKNKIETLDNDIKKYDDMLNSNNQELNY